MLLAIDTSTAQIGVALESDGEVRAEAMWSSKTHHTVELAPAVADLMARAGAKIADLAAVAVAVGPGSFTALRVGLAFAKGLALAHRIPLMGVPTLDIVAGAQPPNAVPLVAVLQAGRERIAAGWYEYASPGEGPKSSPAGAAEGSWQPIGAPEITTVEALAQSIVKTALVAGELSAAERQRLGRRRSRILLAPPHLCVRRPAVLAELGRRRLESGEVDPAASLGPVYLHSGDPIPA